MVNYAIHADQDGLWLLYITGLPCNAQNPAGMVLSARCRALVVVPLN
jgi:hypothetical protein